MSKLDLDNMEQKFHDCLETEDWARFVEMFKAATEIYIIGNGGQASTAQHAASDTTRLVDNKIIRSFDNMSYLTSVANDYGYETVFQRWIEKEIGNTSRDKVMVIGLSCSGNSPNIVDVLEWADHQGIKSALISGTKSVKLSPHINEVCMYTKYFHSSELISMLLIYEAIGECGGRCPTLVEENIRKGFDTDE